MRSVLALLLAAALAACGGGSDEPQQTQSAQSAPAAEAAPPHIELFGDSTLRMVGFELAKVYGDRIENRAVNGTSSTMLIAGTDGLNAPWPGSVDAPYVIVNHGLADGYAYYGQLTQAQYRANLEILASAPGAQVIFQTPLPSTAPGRDMTEYAQTMREVAAERGLRLIDMNACFLRAPAYASLFVDGTHPNAAGLAVMVACMRPTLDALR